MRSRKITFTLKALVFAVLAIPGLLAASGQAFVKHQNLSEMVAEADRIYRGTVTSVQSGEVTIGANSIPSITYTVLVTELFKGEADQVKDGKNVMELQVAGTNKPYLRMSGDFAQLSTLPAPPSLEVGDDALMFTNAPNQYGLSNTIGLGQGYFHINDSGSDEGASNQLQNLGLFKGMGTNMPVKGEVAYSELANMISAELNR